MEIPNKPMAFVARWAGWVALGVALGVVIVLVTR